LSKNSWEKSKIIGPDPTNEQLTASVSAINHLGEASEISVVTEKPLTIYLNSQEIVTAMTIGDYPSLLALGYLKNQGMLQQTDKITSIEVEEDLNVVVVRTKRETNYEEKLSRKIRTSGCAVGTIYGDIMDGLQDIELPFSEMKVSHLYGLSKKINLIPSLYLEAGAIHGTVLCKEDVPLVYMEDVGRHNAVDKVAGWMFKNDHLGADKILYTTGRLTSEMVIKTALMEIPILVSRSGFTAWGVELANDLGMTLIGRLRGKRFLCLSGSERLIWDIETSEPEIFAEPNKSGTKMA
jgi:FdhD protein